MQRVAGAVDSLAKTVQAQLDDLRRANELKSDLINRVSHELATPLTPLRTQLAALERARPGDPAAFQAATAVLRRNVERLSATVAAVVDAARLQSEAWSHNPTSFDLAQLVREVASTLGRPGGVRIEIDAAGPLPVHGDALQIERVLRSIVINALQHAGGPAVQVRARAITGAALVEVTDHGTGLAAGQLAAIFDPLTQVHDSMERRGSGLSLYLARAVLAKHGGRIWADSAGPGRGTTVSFSLPME